MQDESYNAQVSAVFDTDGKIHPRWCKFRNSMGEIIIIEKLTVEKENSEDNKIHRNFWCSAYMYCRRQEFCLSYNIRNHSWTVSDESSLQRRRVSVAMPRCEGTGMRSPSAGKQIPSASLLAASLRLGRLEVFTR